MEINIGKQNRPVSFGLKMVAEIVSHENWGFTKLGEMMQNNILYTTPVIVYYCLKNGAESQDKAVDFNLSNVFDWVGEKGLNDEELVLVVQKFGNSLSNYIQQLMPKDNDKKAEVKKNKLG